MHTNWVHYAAVASVVEVDQAATCRGTLSEVELGTGLGAVGRGSGGPGVVVEMPRNVLPARGENST